MAEVKKPDRVRMKEILRAISRALDHRELDDITFPSEAVRHDDSMYHLTRAEFVPIVNLLKQHYDPGEE